MKNTHAPTPKTPNATRKAKTKKANTVPFTVGLTQEQAEIVRDRAKEYRATPGEFITACAMAYLDLVALDNEGVFSLNADLNTYAVDGAAPCNDGLPFTAHA